MVVAVGEWSLWKIDGSLWKTGFPNTKLRGEDKEHHLDLSHRLIYFGGESWEPSFVARLPGFISITSYFVTKVADDVDDGFRFGAEQSIYS